jgi:membrane protease YdiL (CAAX protease family)
MYIVGSGVSWLTGTGTPSRSGEFRWVYSSLHATLALALLWYVLQRRRLRFSDIGLRWSPSELVWGGLLLPVGLTASWIIYGALLAAGKWLNLDFGQTRDVGGMLFAGHVGFTALLYQLLNPFFEELIVRAYVITELKALTNNITLAVAVSVVLQTSYHFYQGSINALSSSGIFLVYSLYYARTGRIGAPIIAHMLMDFWATFAYMQHI